MRKYRIEFIMKAEKEEDPVNTFLSVATDKGISAVAAWAENMGRIDGQDVVRVHHISDRGVIEVI